MRLWSPSAPQASDPATDPLVASALAGDLAEVDPLGGMRGLEGLEFLGGGGGGLQQGALMQFMMQGVHGLMDAMLRGGAG